MWKAYLFISFILTFNLYAQDCDKVNKKAVKRLKYDIENLASDHMEGREPGTAGEIKARDYLVNRMKEIGLSPGVSNSFIQGFSYLENVRQTPNKTKLRINDIPMKLNQHFYPIAMSSNRSVIDVPVLSTGYGIHLPHNGFSDYERLDLEVNGYVALMDIANPSELQVEAPSLLSRAIEALDRGAVALLLYNSQKGKVPSSRFTELKQIGIPVLFLKNTVFKEVPLTFIENATLSVSQYEVPTQAHNVIGYLDNMAERTVVITAHYDHLGYGGEGSHYKGPLKIHNGADDNASGTAALLEIAYFLKNNNIVEQNNFLFIAFSAEEKGLLGSRYYVQQPSIALAEINYVLNMDMVGRMEDNMPLTIEGIGSSLMWESILTEIQCDAFSLRLKQREDGPSDHAAFYQNGVPALHFWTGEHKDYHKPSDDVEKINFEAEAQIISFIENVILALDSKGKVEFYLRKK